MEAVYSRKTELHSQETANREATSLNFFSRVHKKPLDKAAGDTESLPKSKGGGRFLPQCFWGDPGRGFEACLRRLIGRDGAGKKGLPSGAVLNFGPSCNTLELKVR